jgi:hypothetical protein
MHVSSSISTQRRSLRRLKSKPTSNDDSDYSECNYSDVFAKFMSKPVDNRLKGLGPNTLARLTQRWLKNLCIESKVRPGWHSKFQMKRDALNWSLLPS